MFGGIVGSVASSLLKNVIGGSKKSGGSRQQVIDPRIGFAAERSYAQRAAENARNLADPGRRMKAPAEGSAKDIRMKEEVMELYRTIPRTQVREAMVQQAMRAGNTSAKIKAARYDISDPLKRDTDTRVKPLKLET